MPRVTFVPSGRHADVDAGTSLLDAARRAGLPLASSCRGAGICNACRAQVLDGEAHLSEPTERERDAGPARGERLACHARVAGAVTVTTGYW